MSEGDHQLDLLTWAPAGELAVPRQPRLSKSRFLAGLQCTKRLYLEIHAPELASEIDPHTRAILDRGIDIGELARKRFAGGVLVTADYRRRLEALEETRKLVEDPLLPSVFEGAFEFDRVVVRVDILERVGTDAWRLIEVKASGRVKRVHLDDLAVQAHVLRGAGIEVAQTCLMHVNTQYVYPGGELDLEGFFSIQDVTEAVLSRQEQVGERLSAFHDVLRAPDAPAVEPGEHCHQPYACQFWDHCTARKPARWIYFLPGDRSTVQELASQNILTIDEIPADWDLSVLQRRVCDNREWMGPGLLRALRAVRHPVHHLDFETFMPAVPLYPNTRPYQAIPIQWSNHVELTSGEVQHSEFLGVHPQDPREEAVVALLSSVGREGTICVYSGAERYLLGQLAAAFPHLKADLERVMQRLCDLQSIIQTHYYHPDFQGSFSMKAVLPALVPTLDYSDLVIQDGAVAATLYQKMVFDSTDLVEKADLHTALLEYCRRDTLGMLYLRRALLEKALAASA